MYLIDFGISRFVPTEPTSPADDATGVCGHYTAPEGTSSEPYSYDVYCVGRAIRTVCLVSMTMLHIVHFR